MKDIYLRVFDAYGLKVKNISRGWGSYICKTDKGVKLIKEEKRSVDQLLFEHQLKEHLYRNGFSNIDRYCVTDNKAPFVKINKNTYVVKSWVDGKECEFEDLSKVAMAAETLAKLHNASKGFFVHSKNTERTHQQNFPITMRKNCNELLRFYKHVRKQSRWSDFDVAYLEHYESYHEDCVGAMMELEKIGYNRLIKKTDMEKILCHNNYTTHNLIVDDGHLMVVNFDFAEYKLPIFDVVQMMRKAMPKWDWDFETGWNILCCYEKIREIKPDELKVLYCLLLYPFKFWKICNYYYNHNRVWEPKISKTKLNKLLVQKENKKEFLNQMKKEISW